ncbi:tRNA (adenosine(37)-N6)-dimethylallyltransferase MiaA [Granulibacter bethesdensis]|uniref:tRNA (adenosine(37)-N6)-dimethylallyltransferase MiaA n=1 Tax=Granulibacter bethesdensis TaxID=364410 RepID=UPI00090B5695|nr:tRNA (adenosine(37)-N6)-dimethylallyltransferase MiaA [Granulibacter bethesdensis]APH59828.1 tRNA delta(2)-isopentenylpyrophosphate transferase [Granulibacter bethesdensis]
MKEKRALFVAGPTCSGKSALALAVAEKLGGTVINADSMQIYRELRILTARPDQEEEARVPHRLYGVLPASQPGSAAWWRDQAMTAMEESWQQGRLPILCGGTGLYFHALMHGFADIPDPGEEARQEARSLLAELGPESLHARLAEADPATAARLKPQDSQRIARAWEVWRGTGSGLSAWQNQPPQPLPGWDFTAIRIDPPREELRQAITARLHGMLDNGALAEVEALRVQALDPSLPAMRAHGVPEFLAFLRGDISLPEAMQRAAQATIRYTKRQATWFRNRPFVKPPFLYTIDARIASFQQLSERSMADMLNFIRAFH